MITKSKFNTVMLTALSAAILSASATAGTMGDASTSNTYVFFEAGGSYTHAFYKDRVISAETFTVATPNGVSYNPKSFYPKDFGGGYIELSLLRNMFLFNARYDMFASSTGNNFVSATQIKFAPSKLSFSVDKVWGTPEMLAYGAGAGVVLASINQGYAISRAPHVLANGQFVETVLGESIQGRNRIDPLVEAFAMYHISDNFNVRLNVAYQIPVNSLFTDGSLNTNLGFNYALPI